MREKQKYEKKEKKENKMRLVKKRTKKKC